MRLVNRKESSSRTAKNSSDDNQPVVDPPSSMTVVDYNKPILWKDDKTALVRKIGY